MKLVQWAELNQVRRFENLLFTTPPVQSPKEAEHSVEDTSLPIDQSYTHSKSKYPPGNPEHSSLVSAEVVSSAQATGIAIDTIPAKHQHQGERGLTTEQHAEGISSPGQASSRIDPNASSFDQPVKVKSQASSVAAFLANNPESRVEKPVDSKHTSMNVGLGSTFPSVPENLPAITRRTGEIPFSLPWTEMAEALDK